MRGRAQRGRREAGDNLESLCPASAVRRTESGSRLRLEIDRVERFADRLMTKPHFLVSVAQLMPERLLRIIGHGWREKGMLAAQAGNSGLNWPGPNHLFLLAGPDKFGCAR